MIQIDKLTFSYPRSEFDLTISELQIEAHRATAVVGPSGSGKTTLLHLMAGILKPDSGQICVDDVIVSKLSDSERRRFRSRRIGLIFQEFELIEYLSVLDNVLLPARITSVVPLTDDTRDRARLLLEQTGLGRYARKPVTQLSQGERQRVAICRALLSRPALLLADEPTGNLDPATSHQLLDLLLKTVRDEETTLVMVTHDHTLLNQFDNVLDFNQFLTSSGQVAVEGESV